MKEVIETRIGALVWKARLARKTSRELFRMGSEKHRDYTIRALVLMEAARVMYGPGAKDRNARREALPGVAMHGQAG